MIVNIYLISPDRFDEPAQGTEYSLKGITFLYLIILDSLFPLIFLP